MEVKLYRTSYIWRPAGKLFAYTYQQGRFTIIIALTDYSNKTGIVATLKVGDVIFDKIRFFTFSKNRPQIIEAVKDFILYLYCS